MIKLMREVGKLDGSEDVVLKVKPDLSVLSIDQRRHIAKPRFKTRLKSDAKVTQPRAAAYGFIQSTSKDAELPVPRDLPYRAFNHDRACPIA
ncbi:hypothetical protein KM043_017998 [Ampulex compressa]|nr:hypothetical protein KM043_017998 [Ampulex compressa]